MLLRNRSRAVTKQTLMGEKSPNQNFTTPIIPSLFGSQNYRDFHFTKKNSLLATEALISPTSILDTRALSSFENPFSYDKKPKVCSSRDKVEDSKVMGLALVGVLKDQDECFYHNSENKVSNKKVLFGTELRVKIPPLPPSTFESKNDFFYGKVKDSQKGNLSLSEMELSEEYTCVISHGPNPRKTHIFDNCVVESQCSVTSSPHSCSLNFLEFCYTCKIHLEHTKDIFIYRGEKAFCSQECRHQEMMLDGAEN